MTLAKLFVLVISLTLSLSVLAITETKQYTSESTILLNQLQNHIRVTLLAVSDNEKKVGNNMHDFHYLLAVPAQELVHLGLVFDSDNVNNGYDVLSVTPGSTADKLGIKSKDIILKINDIIINNSTTESAIHLLKNLKIGNTLKLTVKSETGERELTSTLTGQYVPEIRLELGPVSELVSMKSGGLANINEASKSCGVVSVLLNPPEARDIFPASIHKIDDDHLKRNRSSFKLPVGKHTIYIQEYIDVKNITIRRRSRAKPIEIEVKENTTYRIGAQFHRDKALKIHKGGYWSPMVWNTFNQECSI